MNEPDAVEAEPVVREPFFRSPKVVLILIAVLVGVHVAISLAGDDWRVWSLYAFSFIPARISGGVPFPAIWGSQVWSFVTYGLFHADMMHLFFNSLWLLVFGSVVARRLGALKFLVLACVSTIMGAVATLLTHWGEMAIVIGASGAVSGLMAAAIPLMYGVGLRLGDTYRMDIATVRPLRPLEILTNRRAFIFTLIWIAVTLFSGASGWTGASFMEEGRIAWEAHLGGFVAGLFAFYWLDRRN
ncbi:MAG: rhomboid family intramembrane serine protease [Aestuariivirga sp.]|nr:rhomboid family intramembrane serine protease [Aestuariivirga sp.]